ncbi:MAG: IS4 family transposase, partial [Desulfobacterales bacterium]|nr:IS4 family transposase [Desulfobacterales bacterium]
MPQIIDPEDKNFQPPTFEQLFRPVQEILRTVPSLESQGSRPLALTFEDRMKALTFFHIEEHTSGRHLLQ